MITYNTTNHVNFGDYIVDKGNEEKILNDNVTGIQMQIEAPLIVQSCEDPFIVEPNCVPVQIFVNGVFDQNINSGGSYNCVTSGSEIYDIFLNGVDTGQDLDFDGTNHTINLS